MSDASLSLGLTLDAAAAAIGISRSTLERRIRAGAIQKRKDGGIVRVPEAEIRRYVAAATVSPTRRETPQAPFRRGRKLQPGEKLW